MKNEKIDLIGMVVSIGGIKEDPVAKYYKTNPNYDGLVEFKSHYYMVRGNVCIWVYIGSEPAITIVKSTHPLQARDTVFCEQREFDYHYEEVSERIRNLVLGIKNMPTQE